MQIHETAHVITVFPSNDEGYEMHDWKCSCGEASRYDCASFGMAAEAALTHVPGDREAFVTRPSSSRGGES